ncbi:imm11 family protein [Hyalangium minutum]|uniref:Immunity MXAN-0049 protein domain-containing protein n=1 Tax=Hyalangium minutum TaxID=394096 RepID=A0A085WWS0_9BACT|nr:DUF1629 domain-containing protein [Hyalangium minutum]KFE72133.1 hypothetical protein DB31_0394 [Hyalangium minutum]
MAQRFFELADDRYFPRRWHLDTPTTSEGRKVHDWDFTKGAPVHVEGRLNIPIEIAGRPLDYCWAGLSIPVVHIRVATVLAELASHDIQLIPADIDGRPDQYLVMVATRLIRCIDEKSSRIRLWTVEDSVPKKVGQYRDVRDLRIDKTKVGNAQVFRPEGWEVVLIVSEEIKNAMEHLGTTGTRFTEV